MNCTALPVRPMGKTRDPLEEVVRRNLVAFREKADLSQAQAADLSGVPLDNLRRYERLDSGVPATVLRQLADVYGHRVDDFYEPDPPPAKLEERPLLFLRSMPGTEIDPEVFDKVMRAIRDANAELRGKKKPRRGA